MCERFLKFLPTKHALHLARKHPNAFILLMFIAERARRNNGEPDGLTIGQCHLGDYKEFGLTEKEYRTAKKVLVEQKYIKIIETCRTRKKKSEQSQNKNFENCKIWTSERATRVTTIGTLVELCDSTIWDINSDDDNQQKGDRKGDRGATEGRPKGDEQEGKRKKKNEEEEEENNIIAQTASRLRKKDPLSFDFETLKFIGITEADRADWLRMYTCIDVDVEILAAEHWLRDNPTKSNRTLWRKYLNGWLKRNNEWAANKKAFKVACGSASSTDRRTKDMQGKPVENQYQGKF